MSFRNLFFHVNNGNLCDCETQNVLGLQKQITDAYPVQQNETRINKTLRAESKSEDRNNFHSESFQDNTSEYCPEKGKEIIPENLVDTCEFQTPSLSSKDNRDLYDYDTVNVLGVKMYVHDIQPACQNESKIDKLSKRYVGRQKSFLKSTKYIRVMTKAGTTPEKGNLLSNPKRYGNHP